MDNGTSSNSSNSSTSSVASCLSYRSGTIIFTTYIVTNILILLPLCLFIIHVAVQRRRQRQRSPSSHADVFAYNVVVLEMIGVLGCASYCCGAGLAVVWMLKVGSYSITLISYGQILFHILCCVERHLAVVHPVTYMRLRNGGGNRLRNVTIGCVWLLCPVLVQVLKGNVSRLCFSSISLLIVSFCSFSVFSVLLRPGPGEGGGASGKFDQSKMRAFYTVVAILGTLLFRFGGYLLAVGVYASDDLDSAVRCGVLVAGVWFGLPSSLVLPLLFIHRAGKLPRRKSPESEQTSD
ncbi:uncharacterized protein V6R79_014420 [Siganus canaliculatus]